ncbi:MAG: protein kinase [Isosphaeraceae bacterium]
MIRGYEIEGRLGRGGMGIVYKARQTLLNRTCALKMILSSEHAEPEECLRFLAEAEAIAKLRHPNIVQIHHLGEHDGCPYFEMEYLEGGSLAGRLDGTPWTPADAARMVELLALAMSEAHRQGIVHRDLKPGNVLLTADGTPKVADFGLAKLMNSERGLTRTDLVLGSPSYMAPEQAEGKAKEVGPAADLYALGAILYELLIGRPPFRGATVFDTLRQVREDEPVPPSRLVPGVPLDLETIALKCLQKDPGRRYDSAISLAEDLRRFQANEPILARPVGAAERSWRWCRRNPAVAGLLASTAAALVCVASAAVLYANQERRIADEQSRANQDSQRYADRIRQALDESNRRMAALYYERGQAACEQQDIGPGLLWLRESWRAASQAGAAAAGWERAARVNLGAWYRSFPTPEAEDSNNGGSVPESMAYRPDGKTVLTAGAGGTLLLRDASTLEPIGKPMEHGGQAVRVSLSRDGKTALTGGLNGYACLWNVDTQQRIGEPLAHGAPVRAAALSPDGRTALTGGNDNLGRLWDLKSRLVIGTFRHQERVWGACFSPDGALALTTSPDGEVKLWDAHTGEPRGVLPCGDAVTAAVFHPKHGRVLFTATIGPEGFVRFWDVPTGKPLSEPLKHGGPVRSAAFSPDGRIVVTGGLDGTARLWDAATHEPVGKELRHNGGIFSVAFSPDGKTIVTGSLDGTARLWDAATGEPLGPPLPHAGQVRCVAFRSDGRAALTGSDDQKVRSWSVIKVALTPGTSRLWRGEPNRSAEFDRTLGRILAQNTDGALRLLDAASGQPLGPPLKFGEPAGPLAIHPDGRTVLAGGLLLGAQLCDGITGRRIGEPVRHERNVQGGAFSRDGELAMTWSQSSVRLCSARDGLPRGEPLPVGDVWIYCVEFSPDGKLLAVGNDVGGAALGEVHFWDVETRKQVGAVIRLGVRVTHLAFSPDGKTLVAMGTDQQVRLWDVARGVQIGSPTHSRYQVQRLDFSPDGKTLLLMGVNGTLQMLDIVTGQSIGPELVFPETLRSAWFEEDGRSVLAITADGTAWRHTLHEPPDDLDRTQEDLEALTGLTLDPSGAVQRLDLATWVERRAAVERREAARAPQPGR